MKRLLSSLVVGVILITAAGCAQPTEPEPPAPEKYGGVNGWMEKRVTISIEGLPPSPEDVGVMGVEPEVSETGVLGIDLPTFGKRWNENTKDILQGKLNISLIDLRYGKYELYFEKELTDWLVLEATVDYESERLIHAAVRWENVPELDGRFVAISWSALIYATNDSFTREDEMAVVEKLGEAEKIKEIVVDFTYKGLKYSYIRTPNLGGLMVTAEE